MDKRINYPGNIEGEQDITLYTRAIHIHVLVIWGDVWLQKSQHINNNGM